MLVDTVEGGLEKWQKGGSCGPGGGPHLGRGWWCNQENRVVARSAEGWSLSPRCLRRHWCFHLGRAQEELVWWGERFDHSSFQSLLLPWLQIHCPQEQEEMSNTQMTSFTLQMEIWSTRSLSSKLKVTKLTGVEPWVWSLTSLTPLQGRCRLLSVLIHSTKRH